MLTDLLKALPHLLELLKGFLPAEWSPTVKDTTVEKLGYALDNISDPVRRQAEIATAIAELKAGVMPTLIR